jgi:protein tyrosine phosphatase (PTP) superfamily phosphohydrolase (DUF442 family)
MVTTSANSHEVQPIQVDFLTLPQSVLGKIGLTIAPGQVFCDATEAHDRSLAQDLERLQHFYGIEMLVCLLEPEELQTLQIPDLLTQAQALGMTTEWFPIADDGVPDSIAAFTALIERLVQAAVAGRSVVIHCRGGRGRTGMVAACCLVQLGYEPKLAIEQVRAIRPGALQVELKRNYVHQFADSIFDRLNA